MGLISELELCAGANGFLLLIGEVSGAEVLDNECDFVNLDGVRELVHPHASHFQKDSEDSPILATKMFLRVRASIFETDPLARHSSQFLFK